MKNKLTLILTLSALAFVALACNASFTTANIASLNFGKNEKAEPQTTSFNVGEKVNAVATIANSMSKTKVHFSVSYENVAGKPKGQEAGKTDVELPSSGTALFYFTPVEPGDYKVEATLFDESGKELGKKSGVVNVKGEAAPAKPADDAKKDDKDEDDK